MESHDKESIKSGNLRVVIDCYLHDGFYVPNFKEHKILFILVDETGEAIWSFPRWDSNSKLRYPRYAFNPRHIPCDRETIPNYYSCTYCTKRPPYQFVKWWQTLCNLELELHKSHRLL